jgi:hypothetical protein
VQFEKFKRSFPGKKRKIQKRPLESDQLQAQLVPKKGHVNHISTTLISQRGHNLVCLSTSWINNTIGVPLSELADKPCLIFAHFQTPNSNRWNLLFSMPATQRCWAYYNECDKPFVDKATKLFQSMIGVESHPVSRFHLVLDPPRTMCIVIVSIVSFAIEHWTGQPPNEWEVKKYVASSILRRLGHERPETTPMMMEHYLKDLFKQTKAAVSIESNEAQLEDVRNNVEAVLEIHIDQNDAEACARPVLNFENGGGDEFVHLVSIKQMFEHESVPLQTLLGSRLDQPGAGDEELRVRVLAIARDCLNNLELDDGKTIANYWNGTTMSSLIFQTDPAESRLPGIVRSIVEQHGRRGLFYIFSPFPDLFQLDEG